ncbi:MAG: LLM class flavin-dependent oxidoreductase [Myxococcota bacterium]
MERGLFYALGAASPARFAELERETRLAETLGLAAIWCLPETDAEGGASGAAVGGAPAVWLAALAQATRRIRLGWGVAGLWPPQAAPVREAEQAATLDVASAGRLELALLPESAEREGADEGARMLVGMWTATPFAWDSAGFAVPEIDVLPKPLQQPHPPLWLAGWKAEQALAAGRAGLGFLDLSGGGEAVWLAHRACYFEARAEASVDALANAGLFAVAVDLQDGSELAEEARAGRAGPGGRAWLDALEAAGFDAVVLRAGPLEGGHGEACRRIEWLAGA